MEDDENLPKGNSSQVTDNSNGASETDSGLKKLKSKKWLFIASVIVLLLAAGVVAWALVKNEGNSKTVGSSEAGKSNSTNSSESQNTQFANVPNAIDPINPAAIPLGTGKVSTTPEVGYVDFCNYKSGGVAAEPNEPWINLTNDTWDSKTKPSVEGSVSWASSAYYNVTLSGDVRTISANDLPVDHDTGVFPISTSDPAYQYDHNPNHIA
ncbi:MAG: hypothetical protein ACREF7_04130, partial [Candidatus Saccharimonadales bacterium]